MKRLTPLLPALAAIALLTSAPAQTSPPTEQQQVAAAVKEIQAQQAKIAANQTQIDAKLATLADAIRVAKIYAGRGGH
jgi:uncharacterized protein YqgV (UPF0045/DUF77 family)